MYNAALVNRFFFHLTRVNQTPKGDDDSDRLHGVSKIIYFRLYFDRSEPKFFFPCR